MIARRGRSFLLAGAVGVAACGSRTNVEPAAPVSVESSSTMMATADPATSTNPTVAATAPDTSAAATSPSTAPGLVTDERGVAVQMTAKLAGGQLCPVSVSCRAPIDVEGELGSVPDGSVFRLRGWFDGGRLVVSGAAEIVEDLPSRNFDLPSLCNDISNPPAVNPPPELIEAIHGELGTEIPGLAAWWWDRQAHALTFWFVGNDAAFIEQREIIERVAGSTGVCVAGGADYTEGELREASQYLADLQEQQRLTISGGFGPEVMHNRVVVALDALSPAGRVALDGAIGQRIIPIVYIELLDRELVELPSYRGPVEGTIDILTAQARVDGGMAALATFVVRVDRQQNCVYFESQEGRTVPVWPFGYVATGDPGVVYDSDGNEVTREGAEIEIGGGFVSTNELGWATDGTNFCGATGAWVVN